MEFPPSSTKLPSLYLSLSGECPWAWRTGLIRKLSLNQRPVFKTRCLIHLWLDTLTVSRGLPSSVLMGCTQNILPPLPHLFPLNLGANRPRGKEDPPTPQMATIQGFYYTILDSVILKSYKSITQKPFIEYFQKYS